MKRDELKRIKESIKIVKSWLPEARKIFKKAEKRISELPEDCLWKRELEQRILREALKELSFYHNDEMYYLIYEDGSCTAISAEDILCGEKAPKLSGIVYASLQNGDEWFDTESGNLDFGDLDDEEWYDRRDEYEDGIEIKYGTEYGRRLQAKRTTA